MSFFNHFDAIAAKVDDKIAAALDLGQAQVVTEAKVDAKVHTEHMRESIQPAPGEHSQQRRVNVGAEYGPYVEFGTVKMSPRPFLGPAVEKVAEPFHAALRKAMGE